MTMRAPRSVSGRVAFLLAAALSAQLAFGGAGAAPGPTTLETRGDAAPAAPLLPAPHQMESVVWQADHEGEGLALGVPFVEVSLGSAEKTPLPARDDLEMWTLVGTNGTLRATLLEFVKTCEYLCGDEMEECHYVARLSPGGDIDSIGTPVAALAGVFEIGPFTVYPSPAEEREAAVRRARETAADIGDFVEPIWPEENPSRSRSRLVLREGAWIYEYAWGNAGPFEMPAGACDEFKRGPLSRVRCDAVEALYDGNRMLLAAQADYAGPVADVHASFEHGGRRYLLLRYSLKAQTVWGLLYLDEAGAWHALIRPRDYALLC